MDKARLTMSTSGVGSIDGLARAYVQRRFTILFYSLLFTLVAAPASGTLGLNAGLLESFLATNLLLAVTSLGTERRWRVLLVILAILWVTRLATAWLDHPVLSVISLGTWTLVGLFASAGALRFAMRARFVDAEHVFAALSAYLLAAVLMGLFYWVLEQMWPSSFTVTGTFSRVSAMYFSFVTLATLGYGDIVPRSDVARGLAILEGVGGQLFLAVLVARLVSVYVQGKDDASRPGQL
jgi:voltage-gated potassium channel Kch